MIHPAAIPVIAVPPVITALCAFVLRTAAGFCLAWMTARLGTSASFRFTVWLVYLVATALYWVYPLVEFCATLGGHHAVLSTGPSGAAASVVLSSAQLQTLSLALSGAFVVYFAALGWLALRGLWRHSQLWRALRDRIAPPTHIETLCDRVAEKAAVPRCPVWLLPSLTSAASAGCFRPAVYLPLDARDMPETELQDIACHEMTHIARRDGLWDAVLRACRSLLIFHPGAAYAGRALRLERELACDRRVVRTYPARRDKYAEMLVRFGWRLAPGEGPDSFGVRFAAQSSVLTRRVKDILAGERIYSRWSRGARALLGTGGACAVAVTFPLLCIAFGGMVLPTRPATSVAVQAVTPHRHSVHRNGVTPVAAVQPAATELEVVNASVPSPTPPEPSRKYRLYPSASAPLSDEASVNSPPHQTLQRTPAESKGFPSAPTVLTDAVVELGQFASARDRDHDMH